MWLQRLIEGCSSEMSGWVRGRIGAALAPKSHHVTSSLTNLTIASDARRSFIHEKWDRIANAYQEALHELNCSSSPDYSLHLTPPHHRTPTASGYYLFMCWTRDCVLGRANQIPHSSLFPTGADSNMLCSGFALKLESTYLKHVYYKSSSNKRHLSSLILSHDRYSTLQFERSRYLTTSSMCVEFALLKWDFISSIFWEVYLNFCFCPNQPRRFNIITLSIMVSSGSIVSHFIAFICFFAHFLRWFVFVHLIFCASPTWFFFVHSLIFLSWVIWDII